jgi:hypothetical protein
MALPPLGIGPALLSPLFFEISGAFAEYLQPD